MSISDLTAETLHASCVAIGDFAVLIAGPSGSGKSDVALRLIDRGARLVSDDYTIIRRDGGVLYASPPETIQGKIEVRGIGIIAMAHVANIPIALLVELDSEVARMPEAGTARAVAGLMLPAMAAKPFEHSTPIKIEMALRQRLSA